LSAAIQTSFTDRLEEARVINARGIYSTLGGSVFSAPVWAAMERANRGFVDMRTLLDLAGRSVTDLLGSEAAVITPGASAGLALAAAAAIARGDGAALERLPDTTGLPGDLLIQRRHRYRYDRALRLSGGRLVEVGTDDGTTLAQMEAALSPRVGAICVPAHLDDLPGTVSIQALLPVARAHQIPLLVDAAYLVYPIEQMRALAACGADFVCFSAKYLGGPNAGGFVCGTSRWVAAITSANFLSFELGDHLVFGRAFKLERHLVAATVVALETWLAMDHDARLAGEAARVGRIERALHGLDGVECMPMRFTMEETLEVGSANCLVVQVRAGAGTTAAAVEETLRRGSPSIRLHHRDDLLIVDTEVLTDEDADLIGARLRQALTPGQTGAAASDHD
jgi:D-glucosaminate-6-phosphate ammonia-lyase